MRYFRCRLRHGAWRATGCGGLRGRTRPFGQLMGGRRRGLVPQRDRGGRAAGVRGAHGLFRGGCGLVVHFYVLRFARMKPVHQFLGRYGRGWKLLFALSVTGGVRPDVRTGACNCRGALVIPRPSHLRACSPGGASSARAVRRAGRRSAVASCSSNFRCNTGALFLRASALFVTCVVHRGSSCRSVRLWRSRVTVESPSDAQ
jgi:hypothetical protein